MGWLNDFVAWRSETKFFSFLLNLVFIIPVLVVFHYAMYRTNLPYKTIKKITEWFPILTVVGVVIFITFYFS